MLTRSKSASEAEQTIFTTFAKQFTGAKRFVVKVWLSKEAVKRFIVSTVRSVRTFAAIVLGGVWNAYLLSGKKGPPDSIVFRHVAKGGDADLVNFTARLASIVAEPGRSATRYFDILLLAEDAASVTEYLTAARFFNKRINLYVGRNAQACHSIAPAITVPSLVETLRGVDREAAFDETFITPISTGGIRVPTSYGNLAREFLKAVDCRKKYCVICVAEEWPLHTIQNIVSSFADTHPIWRFIIMNVKGPTTSPPATATANMIWPACAGLEFGTRLALSVEADALVGPSCLPALASILAGRPVTLLSSGESVLNLSSALRNVRTVSDFELGNLASEITSLIDRVDEQEFQFSENTPEH